MKLTKEQIAEIQARADKASKGPWQASESPRNIDWVIAPDGWGPVLNVDCRRVGWEQNKAFLLGCRSDIPALLAHIAEVERERDEARAACAVKDEAVQLIEKACSGEIQIADNDADALAWVGIQCGKALSTTIGGELILSHITEVEMESALKDAALRSALAGFEYLSDRINCTAYINTIKEALPKQST